ncbi:ABC transporter permease [Cellulosimicrobium sp. TH-20]|uniref:ABC transporter permease n=1 Tax=Cellulosimicrobium sp. TH-20 TaxID=1980001 RepID=UPI000DF832A5|nr:ABC transporter permease [Cellulosimicrobium sp. TH-20]
MKPLELLREAWASALAQKIPTFMIAALAAAMCLTTLLTVGRTASAQADVLAALEGAGSRTLQVVNTGDGALLAPAVVDATASLSGVERSLARTSANDTYNASVGPGGTKVPTWQARGDLTGAVTLTAGRWPRAGEALVSTQTAQTLGLDAAVGALADDNGHEYPIVGAYTARTPFTDLDAGALTPAADDAELRTLDVITTTAGQAGTVQTLVLQLIAAPDPTALTVTSPTTLADLQDQITGDVAAFGAGLLLLVLAAGAILTTLVVLADTLVRRKDLGRRRALGASRTAIVTLVTTRTVLPAAFGALAGTLVGLLLVARMGATPPIAFCAGTAVLALLAAGLAALAPAVIAAFRDPVAVLRTP